MDAKGPVRRQILASVVGNLLTMSCGGSSSWSTANYLEFQKPDTKLPSGPLTVQQSSFNMSVYFAGAIVGNMVFSHLVKRFGSKRVMVVNGFTQILNWLLTIYAQNPYYLYGTSFHSGVVETGHYICITIFVSEIAHDNIRGSLNSLTDPSYNIGQLFGYVLANYFDYADQAKVHLLLPVIFMIVFIKIPDSPQYLISTERLKAANKAQKFFKGTELESLPVDEKQRDVEDNSKLTLKDFTNHRARKAYFITISLVFLNSLQGFGILVTYVTEILQDTNPNISPINASAIIICILISANMIYMNLVDRAGRRIFYISSSITTAIGHVIFAVYLYKFSENRALDWAPMACLSFILFVSCLGMTPVPYLISIEIFPNKIKQYGYSNCVLLALINAFFLTELYPQLKEVIGLFGWITFFGAMSLCNALFGIFVLPETKGKSHEEIMRLLDK